MSLFQVNLNNGFDGKLDLNPSTAVPDGSGGVNQWSGSLGTYINPSIQRTVYCAGPNRTYRKLIDGEQFTDCNYWKRFAYPQVDLYQAFIEVITDDGSVYSDVPGENTVPFATTIDITYSDTTFATAYSYWTTAAQTTPTTIQNANAVNFLGNLGTYATALQISVPANGDSVWVQLNGSNTAVFYLDANTSQSFPIGDIAISEIAFALTASHGSGPTAVSIIATLSSVCNS